MAQPARLDTHQKALQVNLDASMFGSFAEIGAGQEVARWFMRVGAASGSVAKTICAYDKEVSDDLYGSGTRYVSRDRLGAMIDREWDQLRRQLEAGRGASTRFFCFADTVTARNYAGTNDCHGWMGIRFQTRPGAPPSDVVLHVNMRDPSAVLQSETLGIIGVNLIHAVLHRLGRPESLLEALFEDLTDGRIEVDHIDTRGPAFEGWNREELLVRLVHGGRAEAVVFPTDGAPLPPGEVLYKKPVVLEPGLFRQSASLHGRVLARALELLRAEAGREARDPIDLFSLTGARPSAGDGPAVDELLLRLRALRGLGAGVLMVPALELYRLCALVKRYTEEPIRFAVSLPVLARVFQAGQYDALPGQVLEGIARLFVQEVRVYAFPARLDELDDSIRPLVAAGRGTAPDDWITADCVRPRAPMHHLYDYLIGAGFIVPVSEGLRHTQEPETGRRGA